MAKAGADNSTAGQKMVPADCVSVLLMAIGNTSISKAQYNMMSALDGSRTASSFEHQFRSITSKAKELKTRVDNGEVFEPVLAISKRGELEHFLAYSTLSTDNSRHDKRLPRNAKEEKGCGYRY